MARGRHTGGRKPGSKYKAPIDRELHEGKVLTEIEKLLAASGLELSKLVPLDYARVVLRHLDSTPEQRRWAPFRYNGEARRIRAVPDLPIDVMGGGFAVAPPSMGSTGRYEFREVSQT